MNKYSSLTTGQLKLITSLKNKKSRAESRLFIVEGEKLCEELFYSSYITKSLIIMEGASKRILEISKNFEKKKIPQYIVSEKIFSKISDTKSPQGIMAVVNYKNDEHLSDDSFIALDKVNDPGNVGTIIRTAEWFGFNQVLLSEGCADKYNPKLVRATMGSIFRIRIIEGLNFENSLRKLFPKHFILGATLNAKKNIEKINISEKIGLIFGSESHGLSKGLEKLLSTEFNIPGSGAESLNVSVAAGISMFYFKNNINKYI